MHKDIDREKQKLDSLFQQIASVTDIEMQAHWAKYLCVLVSGFVENAFRIILFQYTLSKSHQNVANFIDGKLQKITNLNEDKIKQLLNSFNQGWREEFEKNISLEQKSAFDSVIANRHQIAHGRFVGLTYVRISNYYGHIVNVLQSIHQMINQ